MGLCCIDRGAPRRLRRTTGDQGGTALKSEALTDRLSFWAGNFQAPKPSPPAWSTWEWPGCSQTASPFQHIPATPWLVGLSWPERRPMDQKVTGSVPIQGAYEKVTHQCFSLSLKAMEKISSGEDLKKQKSKISTSKRQGQAWVSKVPSKRTLDLSPRF